MFKKKLFIFLGMLVISTPVLSNTLTTYTTVYADLNDSSFSEQMALWDDSYIQLCGPSTSRGITSTQVSSIHLGGGGGLFNSGGDVTGKYLARSVYIQLVLAFDSAGCSQRLPLNMFAVANWNTSISGGLSCYWQNCHRLYFATAEVRNIPRRGSENGKFSIRLGSISGGTYQRIVSDIDFTTSSTSTSCVIGYLPSINFRLMADSPTQSAQLAYVAAGNPTIKYSLGSGSMMGDGLRWQPRADDGVLYTNAPVFSISSDTAGNNKIALNMYQNFNAAVHYLNISSVWQDAPMSPGRYSDIVTITMLCD